MNIDTTGAPFDAAEYIFTLDGGKTEASEAERAAFLKGFEAGLQFANDSQPSKQ